MKKIAQGFIVLLTAMTFAQEEYTINGTIKNFENGKISLSYLNNFDDEKPFITSDIVQGKFSLSGKLTKPAEVVQLSFDDENYQASIFLESGTTTVVLDTKDTFTSDQYGAILKTKVSGTPNNELLAQFIKQKFSIENSSDFEALRKAERAILKLDENPDTKKDAYEPFEKVYNEFAPQRLARINALKKEFVSENNSTIAALYVIAQEGYGISESDFEEEELASIFTAFDKKNASHSYYQMVENYLTALRNTKIGAQAPTFTMENSEGKQTSLSEFNGKYVLVDFWAYWCVPCVESFPHLKKLYGKYNKDGFEIIHISQDPARKPWFKALKKYKNPWAQLIEKEGSFLGNQIADDYNVKFLPTTFLLDKDGKILGKNLEEEALDAKLKEIFGK